MPSERVKHVDGVIHIRDILEGQRDLSQVSTTTMCGVNDTEYKLSFGTRKASTCKHCISKWDEEKKGGSPYVVAKRNLRMMLTKIVNFKMASQALTKNRVR